MLKLKHILVSTVLMTGTCLSFADYSQASIIGDTIDYSIGLEGGPNVVNPGVTGSVDIDTTPSTTPAYDFSLFGFDFSGTLTFQATGSESIQVTWDQEPGLVGLPVGASNNAGFPLYLTLDDLDWITPGPGEIVGASVDWVPGPPTTVIPFIGTELPPTTPAPSVDFTSDSVTLLFDTASVLQTIRSGSKATITLDVVHIPEPLTLVGVGTAVAFGAGFKRKLSKKQQ
jgi:hypothetical protein